MRATYVRYRFSEFELVPMLRALRRRDEPVSIQPKPFELLLYLILHRDRVVPRTELLSSVWPGVVVSLEAVGFALHAARRAIGDDGARQCLVRTFPRCGFRFVGDVIELPLEAPGASSDRANDAFSPPPWVGIVRHIVRDEMKRSRSV